MSVNILKSVVFLKYFLAMICMAGPNWGHAKETLKILAWEGYADTEIVDEFEHRFKVTVELSYANSDDDLWYKINGGGYDVFAVNTAELQRYIEQGLSVPITLDHIPNHARQLPRFQDLNAIPGLVRQDKIYAIPYTYSEMGLIYNRKLVKEIPRSMSAMWDPDYRGRVLAYNASNHNFSLLGLLMEPQNPFQMSDTELERAARELVKLRRNVLTFYSTAEEAATLFSEYDIALIFGNYGTQQLKALRDAGADIGYIIPQEGALAWLDCWAISRDAKKPELAEKWIDYTLEKSASERLTTQHGLANTITSFPNSNLGGKLIWLEPLRNPGKRKALWDRIISGETLEAF